MAMLQYDIRSQGCNVIIVSVGIFISEYVVLVHHLQLNGVLCMLAFVCVYGVCFEINKLLLCLVVSVVVYLF